MTMDEKLQYWSVWFPQAASTGLLLARGLLDPTEQLLLHAAPPVLTVEVREKNGRQLASGRNLPATDDSPICLLRRRGQTVEREDIWPDTSHEGLPVMLPGGEVGILQSWWHAADKKEWRWQVEFYNSLRH